MPAKKRVRNRYPLRNVKKRTKTQAKKMLGVKDLVQAICRNCGAKLYVPTTWARRYEPDWHCSVRRKEA